MSPAESSDHPREGVSGENHSWKLLLFVAGQSPKSLLAYTNLRKLCDSHLAGRHHLQLVDLTKEPSMAKLHRIVALPTLIRETPGPPKRIIGSLSNSEKLLRDLELESCFPIPNPLP
jgi:circadian clock protein KaiB